MPTTLEEAVHILETVDRYLPRARARDLFHDLYFKVGVPSDNYSVRESLQVLAALLTYDMAASDAENLQALSCFQPLPDWFRPGWPCVRQLKYCQSGPPEMKLPHDIEGFGAALALALGDQGVAPRQQQLQASDGAAAVCQLPAAALVPDWHSDLANAAWRVLVAAHFVVIAGMLAAAATLPFAAPWYIALPGVGIVVTLGCSQKVDCPVTNVENWLRQRYLNRLPIDSFCLHYIVRPGLRLLGL